MAKKIADRTAYNELLKELKEFREKRIHQPPLEEKFFFYSKLDKETVQSYYQLKRSLKKCHSEITEINRLIKKMPTHVWLLRKTVFETLMIIGLLIFFYLVYAYTPSFKGRFPTFISFAGLTWFFLRRAIWNLNYRLSGSYNDLIKAIEEEIKELKKLEK